MNKNTEDWANPREGFVEEELMVAHWMLVQFIRAVFVICVCVLLFVAVGHAHAEPMEFSSSTVAEYIPAGGCDAD